MGGFLINGIGAKDYFKKIKYLGDHKCPNCGKLSEINLEKFTFKVAIAYIPTIPLKDSQYAIMCKKCKQGTVIPEQVMRQLMATEQVYDLTEQLLHGKQEEPALPQGGVCPKCGAPAEGPFCGECGAAIEEQPPVPELPQGRTCPKCGAPAEGAFCGKCGAAIGEQPLIQEPPPAKCCPNCGAPAEGTFCGKCGTKIEAEPEKKRCPKCGALTANDGLCDECIWEERMRESMNDRFCANCGARLGPDAIYCDECGVSWSEPPLPLEPPEPPKPEPPKPEPPKPEPPKPEPPKPPVAKPWICPLCGMENDPDAGVCMLCGMPRE